MFDRRLVQYFDWWLLCLTIILCSVGLATLYSAVTAGKPDPQKALYVKQMIWVFTGFVFLIMSFIINYKILDNWAYIIYIICILLLIYVLLFGKYVGGSRRWLLIGPITMQPSEIAKVAVIIVLARYYSKLVNTEGLNFQELFRPFVLTVIPFALIVKQPDLGTALLILLIAVSITVLIKIETRTFLYIMVFCTTTLPMIWFFLKGYQKQRILTFLNPERDPLGAGYHIIQSKIAIGSGMICGKGFLKGTQNALSFLPEHHTDFIFSIMAEEWGLVGAGLLLFIFFLLIIWGLNVARVCKDPFGIILSFGITAMIFWQAIINIGMVMGLMPVVGVPLPFISYGGSSVITMMICIGILINISMRQFVHE